MSRTAILVLGMICWVAVAGDALVHAASGDLFIPAMMGLAFLAWTIVRLHTLKRVPVKA
jgi:hypothetical protein